MIYNAVKMDKNSDLSWRLEQVQVKKLYSDVLSARNAAKGYEASSTYQSEYELGRGCRKKKRKQNFSIDNVSRKNKFCKIRRIINSSTEDEDDCPFFRMKENIVKSPPPVQFSELEMPSTSTKCRAEEDEKLVKRVKLKMSQNLKQKACLNKKSPEKLNLEKSEQDSLVNETQLFDENSNIFMSRDFDKKHESQLSESSETSKKQNNDTSLCVIRTPQKNYTKSFSSHRSLSNNIQLKNSEKFCSQTLLSDNQVESSTESNSRMSLVSSQNESPIRSCSSQLSKNSIRSCNSQLLLLDSQLKNPTKFTKSLVPQSNNQSKSPKESYRRELFLSPTKSTDDNCKLISSYFFYLISLMCNYQTT
ncbi:uncharacterized protein LOC113005796 [Solenopsis invicta]|uniref:uncharacterized protein LOC113005796 n=1 Tax=Solenopsis invicta TaxID=13686 RepID=UPI00193EB548|nr:uncharacterized protein LOC113005796 [Solenopsis invicta]